MGSDDTLGRMAPKLEKTTPAFVKDPNSETLSFCKEAQGIPQLQGGLASLWNSPQNAKHKLSCGIWMFTSQLQTNPEHDAHLTWVSLPSHSSDSCSAASTAHTVLCTCCTGCNRFYLAFIFGILQPPKFQSKMQQSFKGM